MPDQPKDPNVPDLKLLTEDILPSALRGKVSIRTLRRRARDLGLAWRMGRKTFVTDESLATLIETFKCPERESIKIAISDMLGPRRSKKSPGALATAEALERHRKTKPSRYV
jgi:hypothetical protein